MIGYLGGLHKELHHVKVMKDDQETYEPAMVILNYRQKGRSFIVPLDAAWKYMEPHTYHHDEIAWEVDRQEFQKIIDRSLTRMSLAVTPPQRMQAAGDIACCELATQLAHGLKLMKCVAYNLAKCMQMFDITPCPQAMAQLLLWINNGIEDLIKFPEHDQQDQVGVAGEVTLWEGGKKVGTAPLTVSETDLLSEN